MDETLRALERTWLETSQRADAQRLLEHATRCGERARFGPVVSWLVDEYCKELDETLGAFLIEHFARAPAEVHCEELSHLDSLASAGQTEARDLLGTWFPPLARIVGISQAARHLRRFCVDVAQGDEPIVLQGESGVGRELTSQVIHALSNRQPYRALPVPTLSPGYLATELPRICKEAADGTLYAVHSEHTPWLDTTLSLQRAYRFRLIVGELSGPDSPSALPFLVSCWIPPLRDRVEDIPQLLSHFIVEAGVKYEPDITSDLLTWLKSRPWGGNVRDLWLAASAATRRSQAPCSDFTELMRTYVQ